MHMRSLSMRFFTRAQSTILLLQWTRSIWCTWWGCPERPAKIGFHSGWAFEEVVICFWQRSSEFSQSSLNSSSHQSLHCGSHDCHVPHKPLDCYSFVCFLDYCTDTAWSSCTWRIFEVRVGRGTPTNNRAHRDYPRKPSVMHYELKFVTVQYL